MVDVGGKRVTRRVAAARCAVRMGESTLRAVMEDRVIKGNVLAAAKVAGILAAKRVGELVPLCHPLLLDHVDLRFEARFSPGDGHAVTGGERDPHRQTALVIESRVTVTARTGAEMEALQAAAQAALTVYDMCKSLERGITITDLRLIEKSGGKSGAWRSG
jgi:cyclic pyranopterin phosphate synthase